MTRERMQEILMVAYMCAEQECNSMAEDMIREAQEWLENSDPEWVEGQSIGKWEQGWILR